jgi:pimeloyl-ACP methyl ester carboxylesterase
MLLHTEVHGDGDRTALLVHGIMSDARCWHRVQALLIDRGYRVVTVDLAGHGQSPRKDRYSPASWADDVIESVSAAQHGSDWPSPELVVGHSLGGLVSSLVVQRLRPERVIYIDPAFGGPTGWRRLVVGLLLALLRTPSPARVARQHPRWSDEDVAIEVDSIGRWDRRTVFGLAYERDVCPPESLVAPTLLVLPDKSALVTASLAESLRDMGMQVETVAGTGHVIFRDDFDGFLAKADGWL